MRIFCCSNSIVRDRLRLQSEVSIRDADFLLFERKLPASIPKSTASFNPRCGFFAVRTPMTVGELIKELKKVSIRDADFLLFERRPSAVAGTALRCFNPRCGFFAVRTPPPPTTVPWSLSFNPRCGFFAVRTPAWRFERLGRKRVSIRDADFLLFERCAPSSCWIAQSKFQSAMRIFCCSNQHKGRSLEHLLWRFNPRCGFFAVRTSSNFSASCNSTCFNPRCGFFAVRTL